MTRLELKRGYAFIHYQDERDAKDALKDADGIVSMRGARRKSLLHSVVYSLNDLLELSSS